MKRQGEWSLKSFEAKGRVLTSFKGFDSEFWCCGDLKLLRGLLLYYVLCVLYEQRLPGKWKLEVFGLLDVGSRGTRNKSGDASGVAPMSVNKVAAQKCFKCAFLKTGKLTQYKSVYHFKIYSTPCNHNDSDIHVFYA